MKRMKEMFVHRNTEMETLVIQLYDIKAIRFGHFESSPSPVIFDLHAIVDFSNIMDGLAVQLVELLKKKDVKTVALYGASPVAHPIAALIAAKISVSLLRQRKNNDDKIVIEGESRSGDKCLIVDGVLRTGMKLAKIVRTFRAAGKVVADAIVVIDREHGGMANMREQNVKVHSLFKLSFILKVLKGAGKINQRTVDLVKQYMRSSQMQLQSASYFDAAMPVNPDLRTKMSFRTRSEWTSSSITKELFMLMTIKKTNLCLAANLMKCDDILTIADICGPYICMLKTHVDIAVDFTDNFINRLLLLAKKHRFFILEDRKFFDIEEVVSLQYTSGTFGISRWADFTTMSSLCGERTIRALRSRVSNHQSRAVFVLGGVQPEHSLINDLYRESAMHLTNETGYVDFIAGIACQQLAPQAFPGLIQMTSYDKSTDEDFRFENLESVVKNQGADIVVIGKDITAAKSILRSVILHCHRLWAAYCKRVGEPETH